MTAEPIPAHGPLNYGQAVHAALEVINSAGVGERGPTLLRVRRLLERATAQPGATGNRPTTWADIC